MLFRSDEHRERKVSPTGAQRVPDTPFHLSSVGPSEVVQRLGLPREDGELQAEQGDGVPPAEAAAGQPGLGTSRGRPSFYPHPPREPPGPPGVARQSRCTTRVGAAGRLDPRPRVWWRVRVLALHEGAKEGGVPPRTTSGPSWMHPGDRSCRLARVTVMKADRKSTRLNSSH